MTEMTWTTMHIGGALPADKIDDLIGAILEDFHEIANGPTQEDDEELVREAAGEAISLLVQGQVNHGDPDAVVAFCQKHGLIYWLHFDAGYEWDSGIQIWSPGADRIEEIGASAQGYSPMVDLSSLRIWADGGNTLQHFIDDASRFESHKVPPLTIVETTAETPREIVQP
jgi:hypothetical protein